MSSTSQTRNNNGLALSFHDINYTVPSFEGPIFNKTKHDLRILQHISGVVLPGQCCAILGSSGSGKTSLLDILVGNNRNSKFVSGNICLGGVKSTPEMMIEHCGYVMQDDSHLPQLTVKETLMYSALLRLPADTPKEKKLERVENVLSELGLMNAANTKVGGGYVRGVSGGERRRVSIGVQLLKDPTILMLDEPTTGLDAFTANNIVSTLSGLAKKNKTVVFTIHQPRSDIFPLLDLAMLLSQGKTVYFGGCDKIINYFSEIGYPCSIYSNPLDYYIDIVSVDKRSERKQIETTERMHLLAEQYKKSQVSQEVELLLEQYSKPQEESQTLLYEKRKHLNFFSLTIVLTQRLLLNLSRSFDAIWSRCSNLALFSLLLWLFIWRLDNDQTSIQNRTGFLYESLTGPCFIGMLNSIALFPEIRNLFYRESRDGLYPSFPFMLSYLFSFIPTTLVSSLLFSGFSYWAIGLDPIFTKFLIFTAAVFILHIIGELLGAVFLSLIFNPNQANSATALYISVFTLLGSGFLRSADSMPSFLKDLAYLSLFKYGGEIFNANEFVNLELTCQVLLPCEYPSGNDYLDVMYPGSYDRMGLNFGVLGVLTLLFFVLTTIVFQFWKKSLR